MLEINVAQLLKKPTGTRRSYEIEGSLDIIGQGNKSHITGEVDFIRTGYSILVDGEIHTSVKIACSRCLEIYDCALDFKFEEDFFPTIDITTGLRLSPSDDPDAFTIDERNIINLSEAIRQYSIMSLPIKPLCHEDCSGIPCNC
jgi:uncharacterized protein